MRGAHSCGAGQGGKGVERGKHLRGRALEDAAAAAAKQRVAAKQQRRAVHIVREIRDMPGGVPGHVQHAPAQAKRLKRIATAHRLHGQTVKRQPVMRRSKDGGARGGVHFAHAAAMVGVVVRH